MKKWDAPFANNHIKLMKVHLGFIILYVLFAALYIYSALSFGETIATASEIYLVTFVYFSPFILLHGLLAYGAKQKLELSRKASEVFFAIVLLGFPIGTVLSILYFFPKTVWSCPKDSRDRV